MQFLTTLREAYENWKLNTGIPCGTKEEEGRRKEEKGWEEKKKKKKKKKKIPALCQQRSKIEALKEKKASRKKKLAKAEEEKKKAEAKAKKKRKARPKSPEEKDYERLPGTVSVEAGSPVITTTEILAGVQLDRQSRVRIGRKRKDGSLENLYWLSEDPEAVFGGDDGKTITLVVHTTTGPGILRVQEWAWRETTFRDEDRRCYLRMSLTEKKHFWAMKWCGLTLFQC